ncbi:MAG: DUF4189 domain-containing protein [Afipia sp.]|jgi:hypothetical protein|nr:MAG: DUF4189 domain-containing protein [Afipia sp.]
MRRKVCCVLALAVALFAPTARGAAQTDSSAEITFWNSVKDSRNPAEISAYLDKYPNGTFAPLAKIRLESLKPKSPAPPTEQWAAIGFAARGAWGAVWQKTTRDEAEARALTLCVNNGGRGCKISSTTKCGAMAFYTTRIRRTRYWGAYTAEGATLGQAIDAASARCRKESRSPSDCNIRASFCADGSHKG